jgi:hypothetical protein
VRWTKPPAAVPAQTFATIAPVGGALESAVGGVRANRVAIKDMSHDARVQPTGSAAGAIRTKSRKSSFCGYWR